MDLRTYNFTIEEINGINDCYNILKLPSSSGPLHIQVASQL